MSGFTRRDCKWDGRSHELTEVHPLTGGSSPIRPHRQLKSKRAARADGKGRSAARGGCSAGLLHELLSLLGTKAGGGPLERGQPRVHPRSRGSRNLRQLPRRHPQLLRSTVGSGASLLGSPERSGGKAGLAASALLSGSAVPATSPSSTGCAPVGGSLESRGCRFFPRPNLLNTLPAPTSGGARPH